MDWKLEGMRRRGRPRARQFDLKRMDIEEWMIRVKTAIHEKKSLAEQVRLPTVDNIIV